MTSAEVKTLVNLLLTLCPRCAPTIDQAFARAWCRALAPYRATDVEAAALDYARRKPFFPSVSDMTGGLKTPKTAEERTEDLAQMKRAYRRITGEETEDNQ